MSAMEAEMHAFRLPPSSLMINHERISVSVPKRMGKNFTQKIPRPSSLIISAMKEEKGGTEMYPKAR
ncbi:MAG: hypothetical protein NVS9B7_20820 [Flavisolibacter sp.]